MKGTLPNAWFSPFPSPPQVLTVMILLLVMVSNNAAISTHGYQPISMMSPSEYETLFRIMESMSSDEQWRLSYPNPCGQGSSSWPGLECKPGHDNLYHVSRLDFGTKPNPTCKKDATFPSDIFSLPYLQSAFFFNCFTHTKTTISIPPNPKVSLSLQQFSLRANHALTGQIPSTISLLKSLQILTLSQNSLYGQIPPQIFSLTSLLHLDLSYNSLNGRIPSQIGSLKVLLGLDLSYNSLSGNVPQTIGELGLLQKLDLSSNLLTGGIPQTMGRLKNLVFMALSNNKMRENFPNNIGELQSLQYFIMDDNPMSLPLPKEFGKLFRLQELRLANSGYTGTIPDTFAELRNLSSLSLENNRLTGTIPPGLGLLPHIYHLNLSKNMLAGVLPFDGGFLRRLGRNLDLSGNVALCVNGSEVLEGVRVGVGACGNGKNVALRNGSLVLPLKRSQSPPLQSIGFSRFFSNWVLLALVWEVFMWKI
ncbi:hypothetical protein AMTRI_Chr01g109800 [Amborella trichopoda]|nr:piriformospora indica-insensitive protein 2 [Amborella trichopoda]|eukprot:XP_020524872.1 piriformospora indica-insensitive protein 2 [Amborella trichopoda]